jgi:hypothetical protein
VDAEAVDLPDFAAWTPDAWSAFGTNVTAVIALAAGFVAWRQLREARQLRREQAQPYVVCFAQRSPGHDEGVDIVIRNFGTTAARDVTVVVTPQLMRSGHVQGAPPEPVNLPTMLPVLVPGQEWRTFWDLGSSRANRTDLVDRHEVVVNYRDSQGTPLPPTPSVLDWGDFSEQVWLVTHGLHEAATALREINKTVKSFKNGNLGGLAAVVWDGDKQDQRRHQRLEQARARQQAAREQSQPENEAERED